MTMKAMIQTITAVSLFGTALLASQLFAQSSATKQTAAADKTLTGIVSDSMCGAQHMAKDKSPAECTRMCVKQGQKYGLVVGSKVYTLNGHAAELDKLAGQRVKVTGQVSGDTVSVSSVMPMKKKNAS